MNLRDVKEILNAEVLCCEDLLDREVKTCFACDLISEMLLHVQSNTLLVTSLTNAHILHAAQVMDALAVVFVAGKRPDATVIKKSEQSGLPLMTTKKLIFECCGLLYLNGVRDSLEECD
ncbi:MAG TPA: DRTGG domain-containing protein [Syntrophorhabdaceae bacterium]|nr:DRTGG domain-containing protein [Syntrophorhabdaceae bacterium]HOT41641.1 DRTGG domain-containing protein [Syntrophorhabdaceae bacterium]HPC67149.1 DRTGG domain-containing protein [Syntrophorhabdaceae bacterium]HQE80020.1 DRTGG domain-containing protein [Syntrophorhabdaceae bacterium]HQH42548.1 DRTGG domain-containing protein [Syntrophorhabdaceae bacterium]